MPKNIGMTDTTSSKPVKLSSTSHFNFQNGGVDELSGSMSTIAVVLPSTRSNAPDIGLNYDKTGSNTGLSLTGRSGNSAARRRAKGYRQLKSKKAKRNRRKKWRNRKNGKKCRVYYRMYICSEEEKRRIDKMFASSRILFK